MNEAENKIKKEYEMAYLLAPNMSEEKLNSETAELKKIISENGGEAIELSIPRKKLLAYPVKKQAQAYFGVVYFNINREEIGQIKKILTRRNEILRYLILNEPLKPKSAAAPEKPIEKSAPEQSFNQKLESILNR